jgi:hypothetical protein
MSLAARINARARVALLAVSLPLLGACGDGGANDQPDIAAGPLSGTVGGKPWTLVTAETDPFLSTGDTYFATLYAEAFTPCTGAGLAAKGDHVIVTIPKTPGDHPLGASLTATFAVWSLPDVITNLITDQGHVVVDSVTDASIVGGGAISGNASNSVNGHFQITVCP